MKLWSGEISDDSGFLGIVDPASYHSIDGSNITAERIFANVRNQMDQRRMLFWATGREDMWQVEVVSGSADETKGYREVCGPIEVSAGCLCLVNYESLTRVTRMSEPRLPLKHLEYACFRVSSGLYRCSIIQLVDPAKEDASGGVDFRIVLEKTNEIMQPWEELAWYTK